MKHLVLGKGEIGKAVYGVFREKHENMYSYDLTDKNKPPVTEPDIMHVCFPFSKTFVSNVLGYIDEYKPNHVIVWSTVGIGTTKKIPNAVHSPVEGRHPKLGESIHAMTRWVGYNDDEEAAWFRDFFKQHYFRVQLVENSDFTEFLKLRSTSKYGINLVWTEYESRAAEKLGMEKDLMREFDKDYNKLYHNLQMDWAQRYILGDPHGKIGGHCVVPNAELLDKQFPSELLKMIKEMK